MKITNKTILLSQTDEAWIEIHGDSKRSFDLYFRVLSSGIPAYDFLKREDLTVSQMREGLDKAMGNGQTFNQNISNVD